MNKYYIVIILILLCACSKDDNNSYINKMLDKFPDTLRYDISEGERDIVIAFSTPSTWRIRNFDTTWYSLSPLQGNAGNMSLLVQVDENKTFKDRKQTFSIVSGNISKVISIAQKLNFGFLFDRKNFTIGSARDTINIQVSHNISYDIEVKDSAWIMKLPEPKSISISEISFIVEENRSDTVRRGEIIFKGTAENEYIRDTIRVIQQRDTLN